MTRSIRFALLLSTSLVFGAVGCGDDDDGEGGGNQAKCDKAYEILKACDADDGAPTSCNDQDAKAAQCVIDHPKGACSEDLDAESEAFFNCLGVGF